ncbi:MAG: SLC13 family permease [Phycisphaerales bacterium]
MTEREFVAGPQWARWLGFALGPLLALTVYLLLPAAERSAAGEVIGGLGPAGRAAAAVGVLMAVWWLSEALPLEATALVPLVAFPLLGVLPIKEAAAPYANEVIFLFLGGLILGVGMERWGLHRRVALNTIGGVGTSPAMVVGGVMLATAMISMWVSNTATAVMMLPIGMSVVRMMEGARRGEARTGAEEKAPSGLEDSASSADQSDGGGAFATCLLLGIAYAASIGGVATLVGSPPNAVMRGFASAHGLEPPMTFARWMWIGVPTAAVFLPVAWLVLTRVIYRLPRGRAPGLRQEVARQRRGLGPMSGGEWAVFIVFVCTAGLWVFRGVLVEGLGLRFVRGGVEHDIVTDSGIAIAAALALFAIPVGRGARAAAEDGGDPVAHPGIQFAMDWRTASGVPWGVLVLFGGGLSLAAAVSATGVDKYLGGLLEGLGGVPPLLVLLAVTATMVFLTEVASNTAVATAFMPVMFVLAGKLGVEPYALMVPVALGASYAFMMPMGTPPNALVFATGRVTIRQMAGTGLVLNLAAVALITAVCWWWAPVVLD